MTKIPVKLRLPCSSLTGYGKISLALIKGLLQSKFIDPEFWALYNHINDSFPEEYRSLINTQHNVKNYGILIGVPSCLSHLSTRYRVGYFMYEASDIPFAWQTDVRKANEIWVPSQYCAMVFGSYNSDVKVVHLGCDSDAFYDNKLSIESKRLFLNKYFNDVDFRKFDYIVGSAGVMSYRKGVDLLLKGFLAAFGNDDKVALVIKSRDTRWMPQIDHDNIFVIDTAFKESEMADFYRALDLFVLPSRGEGFGMPPIEAAMCGTPALTTRYSGPAEYIDDKNIWGIDILGEEKVVKMQMAVTNALWAKIDIDNLIDKLRFLRDNRPCIKRSFKYWSYHSMVRRFEDAIKLSYYKLMHK
ncbi:MAG: glycosyltransferase family 4 protein [Candidatus Cloacimonadaceae bacterium]